MDRTEKLTKEQEELVPLYIKKWRGLASTPSVEQDIKEAVNKWYKHAGYRKPKIVILDNPKVAVTAAKGQSSMGSSLRGSLLNSLDTLLYSLRDSMGSSTQVSLFDSLVDSLHDSLEDSLWASLLDSMGGNSMENSMGTYWDQSYAGTIDYAEQVLGIEFDKDELALYRNICTHISFAVPYKSICFVSKKPYAVYWDEEGFLHNTEGPSVEWEGFKLWNIDGVIVDEQIVMEPHGQSIRQIEKDYYADRKAIRIERYGWPRYLSETKPKKIDSRKNDIDGTKECLVVLKDGTRRLVTSCPTGRVFSMGVPTEIKTCEEAQVYLNPRAFRSLGRT